MKKSNFKKQAFRMDKVSLSSVCFIFQDIIKIPMLAYLTFAFNCNKLQFNCNKLQITTQINP